MKELAEQFLATAHPYPMYWANDSTAYNLFVFLYEDGLSIGDYRTHLSTIQHKKIKDLNLDETSAYLTMLAQHDRVSDCFSSAIEKGTLKELLKRYLELTKNEVSE